MPPAQDKMASMQPIRWLLLLAAMATAAVGYCAGKESAANPDRPAPEVLSRMRALEKIEGQEWNAAIVPHMLRMTAARLKRNYDLIRTWQGTFRREDYLRVGEAAVKALSQDASSAPGPAAQVSTGRVEFALDAENDQLYTSSIPDGPPSLVNLGTGKPIPGRQAALTQQSIVTSEHFLTFSRQLNYGAMAEGDPYGGPVGFRAPIADAKQRANTDVLDPRDLFSHGGQTIWELLDVMAQSLDKKLGKTVKAPDGQVLRMPERLARGWEFTVGKTKFTKIRLAFTSPSGEMYVDLFHNHDVNDNVVFVKNHTADGKVSMETAVDYQFHGRLVYVPTVMYHAAYGPDGKVSHSRLLTAEECRVNYPIDPSTFTYEKFALQDGDRVHDKLEGVVSVYRDGKPTPLFARPPVASRRTLSLALGIGGLAAAILAPALWWFFSRRRRRPG